MYMYYFLTQKVLNTENSENPGEIDRDEQPDDMHKNTFLLALDGDVDFQPSALHFLIDRMKANEYLGAACGRIHPTGQGKQ